MAGKRTLGRLLLSIGIAWMVTSTDEHSKKRKKKKAEEMKGIENVPERDIIIIGIEV